VVKVQYLKVKFKQYKQFWFLLIKLSIVFGAGFFIYQRLRTNELWRSEVLIEQLKTFYFFNWKTLLLLFTMTVLNWFFEILKWQTLVSTVRNISFYEALSQSLSSHTLSIITPFKAGEYGGKALFYSKPLQKRILLLNLVGNMAQLLLTISLGIIGLVFFVTHFNISISPHKMRRIGFVIAFLILAVFSTKNSYTSKKEGYYQRTIRFFKNLSFSIKSKTLCYSCIRYVIFSHQFYYLLVVFHVEVPYLTAMMLIFSMYFIATMVPVFSLFDFVIKGSIALYLFFFVAADETTIIIISTLMWLLNFALPALVGSYFVLVFNPNYKSKFA